MSEGAIAWRPTSRSSAGGDGSAPSPHELLPAALAACVTWALVTYGRTKEWNSGEITVDVDYDHRATPRQFIVRIHVTGELDELELARLEKVAAACPLRRSLEAGFEFVDRSPGGNGSMRSSVDLYWLPLGAGGHSVRLNGQVSEAVVALLDRRAPRDLYHSALVVAVPEGRFVIESAPVQRDDGAKRGVVGEVPSARARPVACACSATRSAAGADGVIPTSPKPSTVRGGSRTTKPSRGACSTSSRRFRCPCGGETS